MGFLAQIVPGLRDARTPLAVGAIWTVTLWISYFLIPKNTLDTSHIREMTKSLQGLPTELLISVGVLVVYVFGIFMEMISRFFRKIFFSFLIGAILVDLFYIVKNANFVGSLTFIGAIFTIILAVNAVRHYLRLRRGIVDGVFANALEDTYRQLSKSLGGPLAGIRSAFQPEREPYQEILHREIEDVFTKKEDLIPNAVGTINAGVLSDAAVAMGLPVERMYELSNDEQKKVIRSLDAIHLLRYRLRRDSGLQLLARKVMLEELRTTPDARWNFSRVVYDMGVLRDNLQDRIKDAAVGLRKESNDLYQVYDRLLSEGEFRRGVSIPLIGLVASTALWVLRLLSMKPAPSSLGILLAVATVIGGTVHAAGSHRVKESLGFLYACINRRYVGLDQREIFGSELFVPTETTTFTRVSEFAYEFKELRMDLKLAMVRKFRAFIGRTTES